MSRPDHETANIDLIIEKIRVQGIDAADKEACKIKSDALEEAERIISSAKKTAETIIAEAQDEILKKEKTSIKAMEFAARDSVLLVRDCLEKIFKNLIMERCSRAMGGAALEKIITEFISNIPETEAKGLNISLSQENHKKLFESLLSAIEEKTGKGIEIKPDPDMGQGFRIMRDGDEFYNDFSAESIAELMGMFLEPEIKRILDSTICDKIEKGA